MEIEAYFGKVHFTSKDNTYSQDRDSQIVGIKARYALNDRLTLSAGLDQWRIPGPFGETHSQAHLGGASFAINEFVDLHGALRHHWNERARRGSDEVLTLGGVTLYPPTARKAGSTSAPIRLVARSPTDAPPLDFRCRQATCGA